MNSLVKKSFVICPFYLFMWLYDYVIISVPSVKRGDLYLGTRPNVASTVS